MALPGLHLSKKQRKKLKPEKFNPLSNRYGNRLEFEDEVNRITAGKVKPPLQALTQEGETTRREHAGREKRIQDVMTYYQQRVSDAYTKAQEAADHLTAVNSGVSTASQANLNAALGATRQANLDEATAVGGVLPEGVSDDVAAAQAASGTAIAGGTNSLAALGVQSAADRVGTVGLVRTASEGQEAQEFKDLIDAIHKKRTDVKSNIGNVRAEVSKELEDAALARATERSREQIAKGALANEGKQVQIGEQEADTNQFVAQTGRITADTEIKRLENEEEEGAGQLALGWAAIQNEKAKLHAEVKSAGSEAEREAAQARAAQYSTATEAMASYFESTPAKAQKPHALFRTITATGLGRDDAINLMLHAANPQIVAWARKEIRKASGKYKKAEGPGPGSSHHG